MPSLTRFPAKDADYGNYANLSFSYLSTNKLRLVLTVLALSSLTEALALLNTPVTGWNVVYPMSQNPATSTATIIAAKNSLRERMEYLERIIFADIPKSILTQLDRDTLNLPLPIGTKTAATKPLTIPTISISSRAYLSISINILDTEHPQVLSKPVGVDSIEIDMAFLPVSSTESPNFPQELDFRHLVTLGRCTHNITFTSNQLQGTVCLRARYLNTRKEPGNWGQWINIIVS